MIYKPWYERYPERYTEEVQAMEQEGFHLDDKSLKNSKTVVFRGVSLKYPQHEMVIVYPDSFPAHPPRVYLLDKLLPFHHQPLSKEICTFGFGASRWSAASDGADSILEAQEILDLNEHAVKAGPEEQAPEPASDYYPYEDRVSIFIPPNLVNSLLALPDKVDGLVRLRLIKQRPGLIGVVTQMSVKGKTTNALAPYISWFAKTPEINAKLIKVDKPIPWTRSRKEIEQFFIENGFHRKGENYYLLMFPEEYLTKGQYRTSFVLMTNSTKDKEYCFIRCMFLDNADKKTRIPEFQGIEEKKVLIIGCGSIGSKIASELARLGVGMTLVDSDFQTLGSLLRHECGINSLGDYKVLAQHMRAEELNPELHGKIKPLVFRVGTAQYPIENNFASYNDFAEKFKEADLVIEATGSHNLRWYLNDLAFTYNKPLIISWVTEGAWGGEAIRFIPGETGCYLCWRDNRQAEAPSAPQNRIVFAPGCSHPTFTGSSFDIQDFSSKVVRLAVQTLLRGTLSTYPDSPNNHLVWSCRNPDGTLSLETHFHPVIKREDCSNC